MKQKVNFSHVLVLISFLCFYSNGISQNLSISYELIYKPDPLEKDKIKKQHYVLDIDNKKSIFRTQLRKESDSLVEKTGFGMGYNINPNYELYISKNLSNPTFRKFFVSPISRDKFYIIIQDTLNWNVLPETAVIANLNCQKAEVQYGNRHWTAWFTKDILTPEGPYYFHGLPGLILEIQDDEGDYIFKASEIKKLSSNSLFEVAGGKKISWEEYRNLLQTFFNNPYSSIMVQGKKVYTDNENGGYKEIDYHQRTKETQAMLLKSNNPIELNHRIKYKE